MDITPAIKALAKVTRTFTLQFGDFKATGVPAILIGAAGVMLAAGVGQALARSANHLPETLREAQGLAKTLRRDDPRHLNR